MPLGRTLSAWLTVALLADRPVALCRGMILFVGGMSLGATLVSLSCVCIRLLTMTWATIPLRFLFWWGLWPLVLIRLVTSSSLLLAIRVGMCLVMV